MVATVCIEAASLFWMPAKEATIPNLVPRTRLEAANQLNLLGTYGSAPIAAALFARAVAVLVGAGQPGAVPPRRADRRALRQRADVLHLRALDRADQGHPGAGQARRPTRRSSGIFSHAGRGLEVRRHEPHHPRSGRRDRRRVRGRWRRDRAGEDVRDRPRRRRPGLRPARRLRVHRSRASACWSRRG